MLSFIFLSIVSFAQEEFELKKVIVHSFIGPKAVELRGPTGEKCEISGDFLVKHKISDTVLLGDLIKEGLVEASCVEGSTKTNMLNFAPFKSKNIEIIAEGFGQGEDQIGVMFGVLPGFEIIGYKNRIQISRCVVSDGIAGADNLAFINYLRTGRLIGLARISNRESGACDFRYTIINK